jgi:hypothetical protein
MVGRRTLVAASVSRNDELRRCQHFASRGAKYQANKNYFAWYGINYEDSLVKNMVDWSCV